MKLDSQVAIITGAGRAIALAYAREGAKLALSARSQSELQEAVSAVSQLGAEAIAVPTDVTSQEDTERLARSVVDQFERIDVLVNNAEISGPIGPLQGNDVADWMNTVTVNLTGTFLVCRAVIPVILEQSSGKIINLSGAGAVLLEQYVRLLPQQDRSGPTHRSAGPGTGRQRHYRQRPRFRLSPHQYVGQDDRAGRPGLSRLHPPARPASNLRRRVDRRVRRARGLARLRGKRRAHRQTDFRGHR